MDPGRLVPVIFAVHSANLSHSVASIRWADSQLIRLGWIQERGRRNAGSSQVEGGEGQERHLVDKGLALRRQLVSTAGHHTGEVFLREWRGKSDDLPTCWER
jgi:hypothetical protein